MKVLYLHPTKFPIASPRSKEASRISTIPTVKAMPTMKAWILKIHGARSGMDTSTQMRSFQKGWELCIGGGCVFLLFILTQVALTVTTDHIVDLWLLVPNVEEPGTRLPHCHGFFGFQREHIFWCRHHNHEVSQPTCRQHHRVSPVPQGTHPSRPLIPRSHNCNRGRSVHGHRR